MEEQLTRETFAGRIGETFEFGADAASTGCELVEVRALSSSAAPVSVIPAPQLRAEPFALLFRAAPGEAAAQGLYRFHHEQLGLLEIFITPVASTDGVYYEAVFN